MEQKTELQEKIKSLKDQLKPLEEKLNDIHKEESKAVYDKIKRAELLNDSFTLDEIRFSATKRCMCGAGLAYPKNIDGHGSWYCSDILLGKALPSSHKDSKTHDSGFPFSFYKIKSEEQPSANNATTRPKESN